jgi:hypothetical protein
MLIAFLQPANTDRLMAAVFYTGRQEFGNRFTGT